MEKAAKEVARQAAKARKAAKAAETATVKMEPGLEAGKDGAGGSGSSGSGSSGSSKDSKGKRKIKAEPEEVLAPPPSTPPPPSAARHANPADMLSPRLAGSLAEAYQSERRAKRRLTGRAGKLCDSSGLRIQCFDDTYH